MEDLQNAYWQRLYRQCFISISSWLPNPGLLRVGRELNQIRIESVSYFTSGIAFPKSSQPELSPVGMRAE